jgi:chemotaxis protein CheX
MKNMVGEAPDEVNEEITDLVGEITNMVTGGAKRMLSEKGIDFDMATPIVVSGPKHSIHHKAKGPIVLIPLKNDLGKAYIEFSFDE